MISRTINEVAEGYISYSAQQAERDWWAVEHVSDLILQKRFEDLWQIILAMARVERELDAKSLAVIAAGPLEDLVCKAGPEFIDQIEREAKFNRQFGRMLTGVWPYGATPEVRDRVVKFCRAFPVPIDEAYGF